MYSQKNRRWRSEKHTVELPTETWGKVTLAGCQANFVRLSDDTNMKKVDELLTGVYKMKKPGVIVSILGTILAISLYPRYLLVSILGTC